MTNTSPSSTLSVTEAFERAADLAGTVLDQIRPEQLGDPTPCTDFDVATLRAHLLMVIKRVAAIGRGESPFSVGLAAEVPNGDWAGAWAAAVADQRAAWSQPGVLDCEMTLPWTTMVGRDALAIYVNELTLHTWDLATAIGASVDWDDAVVALSQAALERELPAEGRAEMYAAISEGMDGFEAPFGSALEVAPDATPIERLAAFSGRRA